MRISIAIGLLGGLSFVSLAIADNHMTLIKQWEKQETLCRGSGSEKIVESACDKRESLISKLSELGWCYGEPERQAAYEYRWHRCKGKTASASNSNKSNADTLSKVDTDGNNYDDLLKGNWGDTEYKTCKQAKEVAKTAFYNGNKFNAPEQDCIVLSSKAKPKTVNLKMLCVFDGGNKSKVNANIKFMNKDTIKIDYDTYRRCVD